MILDPDVPIVDADFDAALETAIGGLLLDWPFPDDVLDALTDVTVDASEEHVAAARAAWKAARPE